MAMIQYPSETASFGQGVDTGIKLKGMWGNKKDNVPNIPMNDPGQMPQVDINQLTQQEQADIAAYQDAEKKSKGLDDQSMYSVKQAEVNSSQSPIVKQAVLMGIPPKELDSYMKDIQNKGIDSPSAMALKGKLGGENSAGWQAVMSKVNEIQSTQKKLTEDWALKAKNALLDLNYIELNPNKYSYKGQVNESVAQFMQNVPNYIPALANTSEENKKWVMEYLKNRENLKAKAGGGSLKVNFRIDENGKLGVYRDGKLDMTESDPNFTTTGSQPISQQDFAAMIMGGQPVNRSEARGVPQSVPKNPKQTLIPKQPAQNKTEEKWKVGSVYKNAKGEQAKYLGNGKWQPQ